jgi:hypothetical protein
MSSEDSKTAPKVKSHVTRHEKRQSTATSSEDSDIAPAQNRREPSLASNSCSTTAMAKGDRSCEEVALIIAGLRGDEVSNDLYDELGCPQDRSCGVSNLHAFELLDKNAF